MAKPFLMLTSRDDEAVAADEAEALPRLAGLGADEVWQVRMESEPFPELDPTAWSGVIVCGSPWDVGAEESRKSARQREVEGHLSSLVDVVLNESVPYLGICYGLGILNLHLGGRVDTTHGEEIGAPALHLTDAGREDLLLAGVPAVFHGYVGHHEAVGSLAPGAELLVTADACPVQMVRVGERAWGTQFHPELDTAGIEVRIREYGDRGYYDPAESQRIWDDAHAVDVAPAHRVLRTFVREFRRS